MLASFRCMNFVYYKFHNRKGVTPQSLLNFSGGIIFITSISWSAKMGFHISLRACILMYLHFFIIALNLFRLPSLQHQSFLVEYWQFVVMQCFHFTCFVESLYVVQETSYPEDFAKPAIMDRSHVTAKSVHRVRNVLAGLLLLSHSILIQILPNLLISRLMLTFPKQILSLNPSFGCKQGVKTSQQVPRICIPESNKKVKESSLRLI